MSEEDSDEVRENRIDTEIIVDAYGPEEQALGWHYYLDNALSCPLPARCIAQRLISPLGVGDEVEVLGMAPESQCEHEMFVVIRWDRSEGLAVPLSQLKVLDADDQTREAVQDWHYWVNRGYQL